MGSEMCIRDSSASGFTGFRVLTTGCWSYEFLRDFLGQSCYSTGWGDPRGEKNGLTSQDRALPAQAGLSFLTLLACANARPRASPLARGRAVPPAVKHKVSSILPSNSIPGYMPKRNENVRPQNNYTHSQQSYSQESKGANSPKAHQLVNG